MTNPQRAIATASQKSALNVHFCSTATHTPDVAQDTGATPPCTTQQPESYLQENATVISQGAVRLPDMENLFTLRDRVLLELNLGKQAPGYKAAQKALAHFIAKLTSPA